MSEKMMKLVMGGLVITTLVLFITVIVLRIMGVEIPWFVGVPFVVFGLGFGWLCLFGALGMAVSEVAKK